MKKWLVLALVIVVVYFNQEKLGLSSGKTTAKASSQQPEVVLFATSWCGYCKLTREFFAKKGIVYTEYDIETSEYGKKIYNALGGGGVPVLDVGGKIIRGYDEAAIMAALRQPPQNIK